MTHNLNGFTGKDSKNEHILLKDAEQIFVEACYGSLMDSRWKIKSKPELQTIKRDTSPSKFC